MFIYYVEYKPKKKKQQKKNISNVLGFFDIEVYHLAVL